MVSPTAASTSATLTSFLTRAGVYDGQLIAEQAHDRHRHGGV